MHSATTCNSTKYQITRPSFQQLHFPQSTTTSYTIKIWSILVELLLYICKFTSIIMLLQIKASYLKLNWCWRSWIHMVFKKQDLTWIWYSSWSKIFIIIQALHAECGQLHFNSFNHCYKSNKTFYSSSFLRLSSYKIWCWIIISWQKASRPCSNVIFWPQNQKF
jgi:hypothetical protein